MYMDVLPVRMSTTCVLGTHGDQKRGLEPLKLKLQMVVRCWEPNLVLCKKHQVLLTTESSSSG